MNTLNDDINIDMDTSLSTTLDDSTCMDVDTSPSPSTPPPPPISRLPPELLSTIFQHTLPSGHDIDNFPLLPEPHYSRPPLLLGRVSQAWRSVSCATPGLWKGMALVDRARTNVRDGVDGGDGKSGGGNLKIVGGGAGGERFAITVDLVRDWLARSQGSLLSINFVGGYTDWRERERSRFPVHSILLELTMHASRWAHVSFSLGVTDISLLSTLAQNHILLPHLRTLRFTATTSPPPGFDVSRLDKDKAPKLTECIVNVAGLRLQFGSPSLTGLSKLQILELHEPRSVFELLDVLDHCPLLVKLNVTISLPFNASSTNSSSTRIGTMDLKIRNMPHLQVLDLWMACERASSSTSLFTSTSASVSSSDLAATQPNSITTPTPVSISLWHILHLPALQKLRVVASHPLRFEVGNILVCITNSGTRLREVYLRGLRMNVEDVRAVLEMSPGMRRVEVMSAESGVVEGLLRALTIPVLDANQPLASLSSAPILCPHLQALSLPKYASADYEVLTRMLLSRCASTIASLCTPHANSSTIATSTTLSPLTDLYLPLTARSTGPGPGAGAAARVAAILSSPALNEEEREVIRREVRFVFEMFEDLWNAVGSDVVLPGVGGM